MPHLGTVAANGAVYSAPGTLDEARAFLRAAGLGIAGVDFPDKPIWKGWTDEAETRRGAIYHGTEGVYGAWWTREDI